MPNCQYCGGWIEFRIVDGRAIPIHEGASCSFGAASWGHGRPYTPRQSARGDWFLFHFGAYPTYTIPNARCPVCGAEVFFYQSPFGGRVFFDELGPPWPKHPCTDTNEAFRARFRSLEGAQLAHAIRLVQLDSSAEADPTAPIEASAPAKRRSPEWLREGWRPFLCQRALSGPRGLWIEGVLLAADAEPGSAIHFRQASLRNMFSIRTSRITIGRDLAQNANRIIDRLIEEVVQVRLRQPAAEFSTITVDDDGALSVISFGMMLTDSIG